MDRSRAEEIALGISVWIDGLWLRRAIDSEGLAGAGILAVNGYLDQCLAAAPMRPSHGNRRASPRRKPADH